MLKKFQIFTKKNQIKLTYCEKNHFFIMMPGKSSSFTPPILNFCLCFGSEQFWFLLQLLPRKRGGDLKSESKKRESFGFCCHSYQKSVGDLKVNGIKSVIFILILGTENVLIIQMTTSPVSSALCQVHNEPDTNCDNTICYPVEEKLG